MSILIALVIVGIILIMAASVNDATTSTNGPTATAILTSPLSVPASNVAADDDVGSGVVSGQGVSGQSEGNSEDSTNGGTVQCASGCMLDNMCGGGESIIARADPNSDTRYYYTTEHPEYSAFRTAETQGEINYYFCTTAQAESQGWSRAP